MESIRKLLFNMDKKFYVSLEAKELLIEKGYPIEKDRPTKSEAIDWLEGKGIYISTYYRELTGKFFCEIHYNKMIYKDKESDLTEDYKTLLEAKDAAIINACKLLKNGN